MSDLPALPTTAGLHHVSVLAADPSRNARFWTGTMGQRLVKRTVNYDAPSMHHLYYGDGRGAPGTVLTFFPVPNAAAGTLGTGETSTVAYAVPAAGPDGDPLEAWAERLRSAGAEPLRDDRFGRPLLSFRDPDGLRVELIATPEPPAAAGYDGEPVPERLRLRGFNGVTLRVADARATSALLRAAGYRPVDERAEGRAHRVLYRADAADGPGAHVEVVAEGRPLPGRDGRGTVHHVAFRLPDDAAQAAMREALLSLGLQVSHVRERTYFRSIYVREPGGVLFEFATDRPGMTADEPVAELGRILRLPDWAEPKRAEIEASLPPLELATATSSDARPRA